MSRDSTPFFAGLGAALVPWLVLRLILWVTGCFDEPGGPTCEVSGMGIVLLWWILAALGTIVGGAIAGGRAPSWRRLGFGLGGFLVWVVLLLVVATTEGGIASRATEVSILAGSAIVGFLVGFGGAWVVARVRSA